MAAKVMQVPERTGDQYVEELFEAVTLEQLRAALASLYENAEEVPSVRTRAEATKQIWAAGGARAAHIAEKILDVEAHSGMKHCFLARVRSSSIDAFAGMPLKAKFVFGRTEGRLAFIERSAEMLTATIEHYVPVVEWIETDEYTKSKQERKQRHPLVVRFDTKRGVLSISYPGFSQGAGTKSADRISYEQLLSDFVASLRERFQISVAALPIQEALLVLQDSESARVRIVQSEIQHGSGKLVISSDDDRKSVSNMLLDLVGGSASKGTRAELSAAISESLREANSKWLVAHWPSEGVYTRTLFWGLGTELLFIWHDAEPSLSLMNEVIRLLCDMAISIYRPKGVSAWAIVGELSPGEIVTPGDIANKSGCDFADAKKVVFEAVRAAILIPVYRLRSNDLIPTTRNRWTRDLPSIAVVHRTDSGSEIDGADPRNIEVAFRRVKGEPSP